MTSIERMKLQKTYKLSTKIKLFVLLPFVFAHFHSLHLAFSFTFQTLPIIVKGGKNTPSIFSSSSIQSVYRTKSNRFTNINMSFQSEEKNNHEKEKHVKNVLFIECGFGNDSHGQSATKAAVRACRNSIEFNSIPSINNLVPGGYDNLKLSVILAIPPKYQAGLDLETVAKVFPYGEVEFIIQDGGMVAPSGIAIDKLGDTNDDMVVVCAAVTVGY